MIGYTSKIHNPVVSTGPITRGLTAVTDDEGRSDETLYRGKILVTVLYDVYKCLRRQTADFRERLLDAGDGRIKEVKEAIVVKRNQADLPRDFNAKFTESADRAKQYG